jgi:hypothetical protein
MRKLSAFVRRPYGVADLNLPNGELLLAVLSMAISLVILGYVLYYCYFGFDLTDEGFYLNWMSDPFSYVGSVSQFGFIYHPLYLLLGGDVAMLRQVNIVLTYFLSMYTAWLILRVNHSTTGDYIQNLALSAAFATAMLTFPIFSGLWLPPTPSYNWLAFQGLLVSLVGILLAEQTHHRRSTIGWVLIGVGGWLTFLGKPSSPVILAVLVSIYLVLSKKWNLRQVLISMATAIGLLFATAILIDGNVLAFVERYILGLELFRALSSHNQPLFRIEPLMLSKTTLYGAIYLFALTFASIWVANWRSTSLLQFRALGSLALSLFGVTLLIVLFRAAPQPQGGMLLVSIAIALLLAGWIQFSRKAVVRLPSMALGAVLVIFPYAYAFGTGNNYWVQMTSVSIFVLLAALAVSSPWFASSHAKGSLLAVGFVVQFLSLLLIINAIANPYRNPQPLTENKVTISIRDRSSLKLADSHGKYLNDLKLLANQSGFRSGTPMIDMTGHSPGVIYSLGAKAIGSAWIFGGYPGSADYVSNTLSHVSCEQLVKSWLLGESEGPRPIPERVLDSFGANMTSDYSLVGSIPGPHGVPQQLLRPRRNELQAKATCELARQNITKRTPQNN